jgi:predicted dehydrogenase
MKILKWGLIGAGDIARKRVASALRDLQNCDLVGISRARAEFAESFAKEFGARKWFSDWREMLTDQEIEAVYIATPVYLHAAQTIAAAEAGKHVLCEKPMAMTVKECDEMIAACRANNVKLGVAYYRRFYPSIQRIKQIIGSGEIGKVSVAQINAFEYVDLSPEDPQYWFLEKAKSGGGPMMDFGCHRLEVLTNLFGAVRRVESIVANVVFEREVEDTASALLQFENRVCANLTVTHAANEKQDTLHIFGSKGSIHMPVLNQSEIRIKIGDKERTEFHPTAANTHQPLIEDFAEAVLLNRQLLIGGEIGKNIAHLEEEIYKNS